MTAPSSIKKSVRFSEGPDSIHIIENEPTMSQDMYATQEEFSQAKDATKADAAKLRKEGYDSLFEDSFVNPPEDVQKRLNEFAKHSDGRGLERHTSQKHYEQRMQHRMIAIQAILLGQAQARKQGLKIEDVSEQLRELSIQYCCTAKIFARRMGKADEAACYKKSSSNNSLGSKSSSSLSASSKKALKKMEAKSRSRKSTSMPTKMSGHLQAGRTAIVV